MRIRIENELRQAFGALDVDHEARVTSSALARIFFTVWLPGDATPSVTEGDLERRVSRAARSWPEGILDVLRETHPGLDAEDLSKRWGNAFPAEYRVKYSVEDARADIARLEQLDDGMGSAARLYMDSRTPGPPEGHGRLRLYLREPQSLTHILPYLEHLGLEVLEERPYEIVDSQSRTFFLYDLSVRYPADFVGPEAQTVLPSRGGPNRTYWTASSFARDFRGALCRSFAATPSTGANWGRRIPSSSWPRHFRRTRWRQRRSCRCSLSNSTRI